MGFPFFCITVGFHLVLLFEYIKLYCWVQILFIWVSQNHVTFNIGAFMCIMVSWQTETEKLVIHSFPFVQQVRTRHILYYCTMNIGEHSKPKRVTYNIYIWLRYFKPSGCLKISPGITVWYHSLILAQKSNNQYVQK